MNRSDYLKQYREASKGKTHRVNVTFSPDEYSDIASIASAMNVKPTTLVKRLTVASLRGEAIQNPEVAQELRNISFLLRNFSNNLNQIAHNSHRVDQVVDENKVFDLIASLEASIKDFIKSPKKRAS